MFVTFMGEVVTEVYGLKLLANSETGKLIKNDNVFNTIMCCIFKKTKLRKFILKCIHHRDGPKINQYQEQLKRLAKKPIQFFGVSSKFILTQDCSMTGSEYTKTTEHGPYETLSYSKSLKLME